MSEEKEQGRIPNDNLSISVIPMEKWENSVANANIIKRGKGFAIQFFPSENLHLKDLKTKVEKAFDGAYSKIEEIPEVDSIYLETELGRPAITDRLCLLV